MPHPLCAVCNKPIPIAKLGKIPRGNLPSSMDPNALFNEYFNCNINGNSITCNATLPNVTWKGTILNVSKR